MRKCHNKKAILIWIAKRGTCCRQEEWMPQKDPRWIGSSQSKCQTPFQDISTLGSASCYNFSAAWFSTWLYFNGWVPRNLQSTYVVGVGCICRYIYLQNHCQMINKQKCWVFPPDHNINISIFIPICLSL